MSLARLCTIPCIHVEELSDVGLRITADDGFRLVLRKVDRMQGQFWEFQNTPPSAITHFHLRYLIHEALNG